ncbi:hypothetical protein [Cellulomonas rhizosphaerae]|uniref:Uncharacterized protein n=1 Tax=Cellulomonas rhizosphaerae TaxID=2293719 RepID=A0A413RRD1_9CELL|nr:hypothetical protein [Cellulomonas rhizosphaerae]RHA44480.1 hypothetical protein D1825_01005 [Cellulomonas rhizosphaerae]
MSKHHIAFLEIRVLPWRPRRRSIDPELLREGAGNGIELFDDVAGLVIGVVGTIVLYVAAPLVAVVLAILFLPVELGLVLAIAVLLLLARFTGLIPWTVLVADGLEDERREKYRLLHRAVRRVRELNGGGTPRVVWKWS